MGDRFAPLTTGPRTAEARQRTLWATVDWSYQLLTDPERVLPRRPLGVPRRLDAGGGGGRHRRRAADPAGVVDLLGRLVDRSVVVADRPLADRDVSCARSASNASNP